MNDYSIEPGSRVPLMHQVARQIRASIARGDLVIGDYLPSVRELGRSLQINFNTVAKAYRLLEREDLIDIKHGLGARVKNVTVESQENKGQKHLLSELEEVICQLTLSGANQEEVVDFFAEAIGRHYS